MRIFLAFILAMTVMTHDVTVEKFTDEIIKIGDKNCSCSFVFKVKKNKVSKKQSKVSCQDNCIGTSELIQLTSQDTGTTYEFNVKAKKGKDVLIKPRIMDQNIDELFEGDMLLTTEQLHKLNESLISGSLKGVKPMKPPKNALVNVNYRWPDKTVYYQLKLDRYGNNRVRNTLNKLQRKIERDQGSGSCVKFVEKDSGPTRVVVVNEKNACFSPVGYLGFSYKLNLGSNCMRTGKIEHEFLHALGIKHEQSRWDRHKYVEILKKNIKPGKEHNFNQYDSSYVTHYGLPYDYKSVMHYGSKFFSKNDKLTIKTLDPSKQNVIGQRIGVSDLDIELVRRMYDCDECCKTLYYNGNVILKNGEVFLQTDMHNNKPVYKERSGGYSYCIYYREQSKEWLTRSCAEFYKDKNGYGGLIMVSYANVDCPNQIETGDWYITIGEEIPIPVSFPCVGSKSFRPLDGY